MKKRDVCESSPREGGRGRGGAISLTPSCVCNYRAPQEAAAPKARVRSGRGGRGEVSNRDAIWAPSSPRITIPSRPSPYSLPSICSVRKCVRPTCAVLRHSPHRVLSHFCYLATCLKRHGGCTQTTAVTRDQRLGAPQEMSGIADWRH